MVQAEDEEHFIGRDEEDMKQNAARTTDGERLVVQARSMDVEQYRWHAKVYHHLDGLA